MSELKNAWDTFLTKLEKDFPSYKKIVAGIPFIYVKKPLTVIERTTVDHSVKVAAAKAMKGKRLSLSMTFVREDETFYVYRIRFLVPQQKMFCCGNLCVNCIRLQL